MRNVPSRMRDSGFSNVRCISVSASGSSTTAFARSDWRRSPVPSEEVRRIGTSAEEMRLPVDERHRRDLDVAARVLAAAPQREGEHRGDRGASKGAVQKSLLVHSRWSSRWGGSSRSTGRARRGSPPQRSGYATTDYEARRGSIYRRSPADLTGPRNAVLKAFLASSLRTTTSRHTGFPRARARPRVSLGFRTFRNERP